MSSLLDIDIYKVVISYGSFGVAILFGILSILFHFNILYTKTLKIISFVCIILCTIISIEYYPFQILYVPVSLLIPISLLVVMIDCLMEPITVRASKTLYILNIIYLIFGLGILASSNNTRVNVGTVLGMFIVPNTLLVITYLVVTIKNYTFLFIGFLIAAIVSVLFVYLVTDGYHYNEYDGVLVEENRWVASAISLLFFFNGILFYFKRKKTTPYRVF